MNFIGSYPCKERTQYLGKTLTSAANKAKSTIYIYFHGRIDLLNVRCDIYFIITVSFATELYYLTIINSFIGCYFEYLHLYPVQV